MKYFELLPDIQQLQQGFFANFKENKWEHLPWIDGVKISEKVETPIKYILTKRGRAENFHPEQLEYFNTSIGEILIHQRVEKVFQSLTGHYSIYESTLEYKGKQLKGQFSVINLDILYPAMDFKKSNYRKSNFQDEEYIASVSELILSKKKLDQIPGKEHLFRLKEYTPIVIIDEYGKNLIEESEIAGVRFKPLEIAD